MLTLLLLLVSGNAGIVEVGGASGSGFGPDVAVEVTPIEDWLEIEAGT